MREGALITPYDGQGTNLVAATYNVVRDQPFRLEVLVDVGGAASRPATAALAPKPLPAPMNDLLGPPRP